MRKIKPTTKRKIAGIIAIVLIAAMILSAVLPLFLRTAYAGEAQQYDVEARLGLSGVVKQNSTAPVEIKVTNNSGKDFKGKVTVTPKKSPFDISAYSDKKDNDPVYYAEIELAAGETRQIKGRIPINEAVTNLKITLEQKNKAIYEGDFDVVFDKNDAIWMGVLSDSTRTADNISANFNNYAQNYNLTRLVELSADDLEYIKSINMLVINDFDIASLSADDLSKIKDRAENGALIVIGVNGEYKDKSWFNALVGGAVENQYQIEETSDAYYFANSMLENCSLSSDDQNKLMELCSYLTDMEIYKLVSLVYYYDANRPETAQAIADAIGYSNSGNGWETAGKNAVNILYEQVKNQFDDFKYYDYTAQMDMVSENISDGVYGAGYYGAESGYVVGKGTVIFAPSDEIAKSVVRCDFKPQADSNNNRYASFELEKPAEILGGLFLAVIMIYAVFIGPFLFLILKKKDKKEKAVKYIPVSALGLTAVIIVCSLGSKFQRPLATVVNIVAMGDTGLRQTKGYLVVSAPAKGKINITAENVTSALPLSNYSWDGGYDTEGYSASLTDFNFTYKDQRKWDTKKYIFDGNIELNGKIDIKLINYDTATETLQVELTNNTGYDVEDICAASNGNYYFQRRLLKKLKNGETKTCDIAISNNYTYSVFSKNTNSANGYDSMPANRRDAVNELCGDQLLIMGFINSNTTGAVKVNGRRASKEEFTALYTNLNITSEYDYATLGGGLYDTN